ncbi:YjcQ family protein [Bacillus sp. UMB0893]|uniref:YjcQ family protein n=1 Tax=Bacillus sp. UMB0893 TaxID=2066053 RepID=UPI000C78B35F|nr:YjcQ family protein [Bacillus sp. UMB0893]PLR69108.1 hypothetical protein CYJ36_01210 [Bacillus sp. UMB0893]
MNRRKLIFSILKEVEKSEYPTFADYDISKDQYGDIIDLMISNKLVSNASVVRGGRGNKVQMIFLDKAKITLQGLDYLEENNIWLKTYRGLPEVKEWIKLVP